MQPDVSFVIAAYNAEATLDRAIAGAIAQRGVTVEVIVVDDQSRDGTLDVARAYPQDIVKVVALPANRGPGGARNAGLDLARGRWVAVLDSDDAVHPDRLAAMIARAEAAGAEIAVDNVQVVREDGTPDDIMFPTGYLEGLREISLADYIAGNLVFESRFNFGYLKPIFQRRFLDDNRLRYDEKLRIGEDYILLASALASGGRCVVEPTVGYVYHIRTGSISRVLELHHVEAMVKADAAFAAAYPMDSSAQAAFARRGRSLRKAASFLSLVQHIKARALLKAIGAALKDPAAVRHMSMPIAVRLRRVAARFAAGGGRRSMRAIS
ncbi:glycosyltransferase family 2 protein [Mesorhizobium sp. M2D.F.Ca.ET.185.01.1.1]|uniref:glycosyltransferase family 2 protein n=1 Tax=unclassified Mesorhizobium TaxID=325217 RepID=UPI000FCA13DC|nr:MULTISPECIES: glycosyltransferase family 2 protein [unclassified Mesorhizobium]TGP78249.1 glycosyltransferase family 2 protein [bacterium M00.F.Ca.ET.227.01.1.1]TGP88370.1 glycosyltransferase family 2 protein [bacterium M00.F.Ca.ET.221.01.1.1]TGP93583.1 glycosyltransferase family 2 protein [bacterium M00.F.Ca.ET.222.01.1.1]TGU12844.1 glycosyltransferase family 2 protein [bacterium M00.F.Ca.ET.163.01.1.1]TGU31326.1 glycosyltransferase family 2 protein [bacterium M00.F.Ca.ET.156.01.1.1]TGU45